MTQANPLNAMGQMFGTLHGFSEQRARNQAGRAYAGGDLTGAANALAQEGMIDEAAALGGRARSEQITGALRSGDFAGAASFAKTPEELAQINTFRQNASEQERTAAARRASQIAAVAESVMRLPPAQRRAAAIQYAQQFGIDPSQLPEDMSDGWLEGIRVQALGLEEYLKFKDREADNQRWQITPYGAIPPAGWQGGQMPGQQLQAPRSLGSAIPQGWSTEPPRPNQPPSARPAAGGGERSQPVSVSFRSSQQARQAIAQIVPGVTFTSGRRTPQDNARVQGARGSFHLQDRAWDLVPPRGMSMAELAGKMRQQGFRVLNEGDHVHVSW